MSILMSMVFALTPVLAGLSLDRCVSSEPAAVVQGQGGCCKQECCKKCCKTCCKTCRKCCGGR